MKTCNHLAIPLVFLCLAGCSTLSDWKPTVDLQGDPNVGNLQRDVIECESLAKQASNIVTDTLMGTGVGGLAGGAGGAALGAVIGNPAVGAAAGAGVAGILGGLYSGVRADDNYRIAYKSCLRQRGHHVIGFMDLDNDWSLQHV